MNPLLDALRRVCQDAQLPWDDLCAARFQTYLDHLLRFRDSMNLIGPLSTPQIIDELLLDSIIPAIASPPTGPILDVGSGAGLPGIPLKLLYPHLPITLVEPRKKRVTFLQIATRALKLTDVEIFESRYEDLGDLRHDYVISKAFQPPLQWLETASTLAAPHATLVCMTRPEHRDDLDALASTLHLTPAGSATHPNDPDRLSLAYHTPP